MPLPAFLTIKQIVVISRDMKDTHDNQLWFSKTRHTQQYVPFPGEHAEQYHIKHQRHRSSAPNEI
jgi:hypothetical protein